uniref:RCR-type E3 ubiquitin transferase n=1 Tax=Globodera rostochiensis TaxID=31243 RepID=A0A914IC61_GLORO
MQKSQTFGVSDEEILSQPAHSSEGPTTAFVPCELCGGRRVPPPVGKHLRQEHPGCGGEAGTFGYNSAGHWAIGGGSGKCGEIGEGPAVWYSFCARCRDKKRQMFNKTESGSEEMAQRMKRNAQFLLELNCPEGVESAERKGQKAVLEVQMYPKALNTINKFAPEGRGVPKWHSSDPCGDAVGFLPSSYTFADQRLMATDSSRSVPSGAVLLADSCSRLTSSLDHILNFVLASHHLPSLRANFRSSFFSSVAFSFAFRLWGWLIRLATSHQSVSDVIWHFLSALPPLSPRAPLRPHPAQLCPLAGPLPVLRMVSEFHALLHSLAVVLQSSAEGADPRFKCLRADLTALCFRAWTFQLTDHEQSLLPVIRSLLSAVGNALGTSSDTTLTTESANSTQKLREKSLNVSNEHNFCFQLQLEDLSSEGQLDASSRAQMVGCLIDGSCDTFWESGEEERGRTERRLGVDFGTGAKMMALYIDNISDEGFRVTRVSIISGSGRRADQAVQGDEAEQQLLLLDTSLDTDFSGWIKCAIDGLKRIEINLWGDELGCRVRQLRILGIRESATPNGVPSGAIPVERVPREVLPPKSVSHQLLFSSGAQSDAFALFQSLATQVLCDRIAPEGTEGTDDNALREQVLDMVSARAQLMHPLQQFVGTHLANAVQREVQSLRAHRKRNFSYINALLHLLVRMNSSAAQPTQELIDQRLLMALSDLWLFAPEIVQKRALNAFECLIAGGQTETKVPEDIEVAVKERVVGAVRRQQLVKHTIETFSRDVPLHWSVGRHSSAETAHLVIRFLRGLRPCPWRSALRVQIGHFVLRLCSSVRESLSKGNSLADCVRCAAFWLSVAALTAMDGTDWLEEVPAYQRMKSATDRSRAPLCDNHDDGRTRAQLRCQTRRNQSHRAQPIVAGLLGLTMPTMDFHEGCNRLRLASTDQHQPLLLVLVNPNSLVGLVELGTEVGKMPNSRKSTVCSVMPSSSSSLASSRKSSAAQDTTPKALEEGGEEGMGDQVKLAAEDKCRFCASKLSTAEQRLNGFCEFEECRQKDTLACESILPCGHLCQGVRDERQCPPCLQCPSDQFHQDADDLCAICLSERLGEAPCVQLRCLHFFHWRCVRTALEKRWPGPRISFRFMQCPLCKGNIEHPAFEDLLVPLKELENDVKRKARLRLEYERGGGWGTAPAGTSSESARDESALLETALDKYMYVQCSRCLKAYFGGESQCQLGLEEVGFGTEFDPAELVCGGCAAEMGHGGTVVCERHGTDFLEFKCRFCCSVAVYFCFGTTHFCAACHSDFQRLVMLPRHALPKCPVAPRAVQMAELEPCPLRIASHPPTGEEFALGCGICRNLRTF